MAETIKAIVPRLQRLGSEIAVLDFGYPVEAAQFSPPAVRSEIDGLEKRVGVRLPRDYRAFLRECSGFSAMDIHNGYHIAPPGHVRVGGKEDGCAATILLSGSELRVLVVGSDGGGNLFLLGVGAGITKAWKWNHERPADELIVADSHPALSDLGSGFSDLLRRIAEDWQHFLDDDGDWEYIV